MPVTPILRTPPLVFRLAKWMIRHKIRGGHRLLEFAARQRWLECLVVYPIGPSVELLVPLYRSENWFDLDDLLDYEQAPVQRFAEAASNLNAPVLIDCGAAIGLFTAVTVSRVNNLQRVIAFEPNAEVVEVLRQNLEKLPVPAECRQQAVSNFTGLGRLVKPEHDAAPVAWYLEPGDGNIAVSTIDSLDLRGVCVALKIDVEGGEYDVLLGAKETLRSAPGCCILLEAHPMVKQRTGRDPQVCLQFLEAIRPFRFLVTETGAEISASLPVLGPGQTQVWNVMAVSK